MINNSIMERTNKQGERSDRREKLISETCTLLTKNQDDAGVDVAAFIAFIDRVKEHENLEKNRVSNYHNIWSKILPLVPLLALVAFAISAFDFGKEFEYTNFIKPSFAVLVCEFFVTVLSTLVTAFLPAKRFSEATNNLIKLDQLAFDAIQELRDSNKFPAGNGVESKKARSKFWIEKYSAISEIGVGMIDEGVLH